MIIYYNKTQPNGALTTAHKIQKIEYANQDLAVVYNSFIDEVSTHISWQDTYSLGNPEITGYLEDAILNWSISNLGPFPGGTLVDEIGPFELLKLKKRKAVEARMHQVYEEGFLLTEGTLTGQVLQTGTLEDKTNWLTARTLYAEAVAQGQGDVEQAYFRTKDNLTFALSFSEAVNVLDKMATWGSQVIAFAWGLKDSIALADSEESLNALDIYNGWPQ